MHKLTCKYDQMRSTMCSSKKTPYPPHGRLLEIPGGRGVLEVKILEAKYEAKLGFRGGGVPNKKPFGEGSMDIFWNCTIQKVSN